MKCGSGTHFSIVHSTLLVLVYVFSCACYREGIASRPSRFPPRSLAMTSTWHVIVRKLVLRHCEEASCLRHDMLTKQSPPNEMRKRQTFFYCILHLVGSCVYLFW